ncbi:hypothetical protein [Streptococcus equi]|nr:hypothetical protein [Streptococcus equi]
MIKGTSGRGKSTLLHIIKGATVDSGKIAFITKDSNHLKTIKLTLAW